MSDTQDGRKGCLRCGYRWNSIREAPSRCPNCSSFRWNDEAVDLRCVRCGHSWVPKRRGTPARCPSCRSSRWMDKAPGPVAEGERTMPVVRISEDTRMTVSQVIEEAKRCDTAVLTILTEIRRKGASITP